MNLNSIVQQVIEGEINPLIGYAQLSQIEKQAKEAKEIVKDLAISEAAKYPKGRFSESGATFELSERKVWEYDHIPEWIQKQNELKAIEERAQLSAKANLNINGDTGEFITPATYKSTVFLKVKS